MGSKAIFSVCPSQSDFDNAQNRSEGVLRHGDVTQWGFKPRGIQPIRFQVSIRISQSGFKAPERSANQISTMRKIAQKRFSDMGVSPNEVLSLGEFNQSGFKAL